MNLAAVLGCFVMVCGVAAGQQRVTASELMSAAEATARLHHHAVFVHFGASWCGCCKQLDRFLQRPKVKQCFSKYFEVVSLDVEEPVGKRDEENVGGDALLAKMHSGPVGLPFYAFVDDGGRVLCTSSAGGAEPELGFPVLYENIGAFLKMLKKAAPLLSMDEMWEMRHELESDQGS